MTSTTTTTATVMDCSAFDAALLDVIYDELDEASGSAVDAHAEACVSCAGNASALRTTRRLFAHLTVPLPEGLDRRILDAAESAMSARTTSRGARVFAWLARPPLAVAASVLLLTAAAAVLFGTQTKQVPSASAARDLAADPPASTTAATTASVVLLEPAPPPAIAAPTPTPRAHAKAAGSHRPSIDPAFRDAKALYDAQRFAEAQPRFEALASTNTEAAYYAARCAAERGDCKVAAPKLDAIASQNQGTEAGSRARLDAARCYRTLGEPHAAASRYQALERDAFVGQEASTELSKLARAEYAEPPRPSAAPPRASASAAGPPAATQRTTD